VTWPPLAGLGEAERELLRAAARRHTFARGEVVLHEGDLADSLHLVESGHLAVQVSTPDGSSATLAILSAGSSFGELSLSGHHDDRSATVVALDDSVTHSLSARAFAGLCREHRQFEQLLVELLASRVRELNTRLHETMYVGLDQRLYRRLVELVSVYGNGPGPVVIPLTQEHLAGLAGGTRPTVNQLLRQLVMQGVVQVGRGRVVVLDEPALRRKARL